MGMTLSQLNINFNLKNISFLCPCLNKCSISPLLLSEIWLNHLTLVGDAGISSLFYKKKNNWEGGGAGMLVKKMIPQKGTCQAFKANIQKIDFCVCGRGMYK